MDPSRRELLTAAAALGLGGSAVGYTQRRRLRRLPAIYDLHRIRLKPLPAEPEPVVVPASYLEASRTRLEELIATVRDFGVSESPDGYWTLDHVLRHRDGARNTDSSMEAAEELGAGRRAAVALIERHQYQAGAWSRADARATIATFETQFAETSLDYTLTPGSRLVAILHAAEEARENARYNYSNADEMVRKGSPFTNGHIESAYADLDLATALVADGSGESRKAALRRLAERLGTEIDDALAAAEVDHDPEDILSPPITARPAGLLGGSAAETLNEFPSQPASAAAIRFRDRVLATVVVEYGDKIADVNQEFTIDVSDIEQAKEDVLEAIDAIPDAYSTDPLGRLFHAFAIRAAESADRRVTYVLENANSKSLWWKVAQSRGYLGYRIAAEAARAVPDIVDRASSI